MYCIGCGKEITEESKFCSYCGQKQLNEELLSKKNILNTNEICDERSSDDNIFKKVIGWFLVWVALHLIILLTFSKNIFVTGYDWIMDDFVPFSKKGKIEAYDFREFLVYTITPLIFIVIWKISRKSK